MENSPIEWTDHTFNPWWGCLPVSPACDLCYAEEEAHRWVKKYGELWGKGAPRHVFGDAYWKKPLKWNRRAQAEGVRRRVFCGSMCDVMEDRPDLIPHREKLWKLIEATPFLDWQLVSKRPQNFLRFLPKSWIKNPPHNVWLITSVESPDFLWRIDALIKCPAIVHGLSVEPFLAPIPHLPLKDVEWVIAGGESEAGRNKGKARPMHLDWVRDIRDQCQMAKVPFFFKQWRQFNSELVSIGKHKAGRELDGQTWDEFPRPDLHRPDLDQPDQPAPTSLVLAPEPESESREEPPIEGGEYIPSHAGADLLVETEEFISRYIYFPEPEMHLLPLSLYVALTHCWEESFGVIPYLMVSSPQEGWGKSVLLETMSFLSHKGDFSTDMSVAIMFDLIDEKHPSLYLDEFEPYRRDKDGLAIFNGGYRRGGCVRRKRGKERVEYDIYCPKAFGLVGTLAPTLQSRCITIFMTRGEAPSNYRSDIVEPLARPLRDRLHKFILGKVDGIQGALLDLHDSPTLRSLEGRDREIWTPMFAICQVLAPQRIRELTEAAEFLTARKLSRSFQVTVSPKAVKEARANNEVRKELLADIIPIIVGRDRIRTVELILAVLQHARWRGYEDSQGQRIDTSNAGLQLFARLVKPFGAEPKTIKFPASDSFESGAAKGYITQPFLEAAINLGIPIPGNPVSLESAATPAKPRNPVSQNNSSYAVTGSPPPTRGGARLGAGRKPVPRPCPCCRQMQPSTHEWLDHRRHCPERR